MATLVIYYSTVEARLGGKSYYFTGVGNSTDDAHGRAIQLMKDDEYIKCVHYQIVSVCFGIM